MVLATQNVTRFSTETRNVIRFEEGIYGFENVKDFLLLQEEETATIWSLQSAASAYPSLIVVNPFIVLPDYRPVVSAEDFEKLGSPAEEDLCILTVAVIKKNLPDSVVNLKSPIVINAKLKLGKQIIMEDTDYPVRYRLFQNAGRR